VSRLVTGVGGLPHLDPDDAASFVFEWTDVPYLPQLPNRHPLEGMLGQWGDGVCGCGVSADGLGLTHGGAPGPAGERFGGAQALLERLPPAEGRLKLQVTGPVTLAAAVLAAGHPGDRLWGCVEVGLAERISAHLQWVRDRLPDTELLLVLDEPALGAIGSGRMPLEEARAFRVLARVMESCGVPAGVHCCGDADWKAIGRLRPAAVSLDAATLGPRFVDGATELAAAVSAGTRMIWGAVPVEPPPLPSAELLATRIRRVEGTLVLAGADIRRLDEAWITPACGLSGLTVEGATHVARRTSEVAERLGA
jgi:hypothetical protein